jgi:hypothetical protein
MSATVENWTSCDGVGSTTRRNTPVDHWGVLMARRGRKRQLDVETQYWQLLLSGVGTVEACRQVGIGRKTGYRWRARPGANGRRSAHLRGDRAGTRTRKVAIGVWVGDIDERDRRQELLTRATQIRGRLSKCRDVVFFDSAEHPLTSPKLHCG